MPTSQYTNIAFISYKREDEKWAKWLQEKIEHYKLPKEILKQNPDLEFAKHPRHVFKDTTDLSSGVLAKAIKEGLDSSKFLIVICSPRAAKSEWVCKEVQDFINSGREEYIIPFIIDGEPYAKNSDDECFPEALKALAGERELLGVNINENGRDSAAVKVIARIFDVRFDTLWQRFQKEAKKKRQYVIVGLIVTILFLVSLIAGSVWSYKKIETANWRILENRSRAVAEKSIQKIADREVYDAILALLEVLPEDKSSKTRPYVPEAEAALRIALDSIRGNSWKKHALIENSEYYFSANDKYLLSIQHKDSVKVTLNVTDLETLQEMCNIQLPINYSYISSSDNDEFICIGTDSEIIVYDSKNGKLVSTGDLNNTMTHRVIQNYSPIYIETSLVLPNDKKYIPNILTNYFKPEDTTSNVEVIDYSSLQKWILYKKVKQIYPDEQDIFIESYKLYDISKRTILWEVSDTTIIPTNYNDVSLSHNGNFVLVTRHGSLDIFNINKNTYKTINTGKDSDHYSNHSVITKNEKYIFQHCDFTKAHIYDLQTCICLDSIDNFPLLPYTLSSTQNGATFVINFYDGVECISKPYLFTKTNDIPLKQPKDIKSSLIRKNINNHVTTRLNIDNSYVLYYDDNRDIKWECMNAKFIGYTSDMEYIAVVKDGMRGYLECQILEKNSGICMYSESPEYPKDEIFRFLSYRDLLNTCKEIVRYLKMTESTRKSYYLQ